MLAEIGGEVEEGVTKGWVLLEAGFFYELVLGLLVAFY